MKHRVLILSLAAGVGLATVLAVGSILVAPATVCAYDYSEAEACGSCHYGVGGMVMPFTADMWLQSRHADSCSERVGNTYCARCHSPFQADPDATYSNSDPVPFEDWQAVTCGSCHPPHTLRVEWETPIGNYDVDAGEWFPVYEEDANQLCEYCHSGSRHGKEFQGFGGVMFEHKGVRCVDCHMAKVPNLLYPEDKNRRAHDMKVEANLPYSCGTVEGGCHSNKTTEWAEKQIQKDKIHGKTKTK